MKIEDKLVNYPLFRNITEQEIRQLMSCINFTEKSYKKSEYLLMEGEKVNRIGIIVRGNVIMEKEDLNGNSYCFRTLQEDEIFGDPFLGREPIECSVNYRALTDCDIIYFGYKELFTLCSKHCKCHKIMAENLAFLLSQKTRSLLAKIEILSKKSMRDRLMTFFALVSRDAAMYGMNAEIVSNPENGEYKLLIPYNHTELAEYLCVNRSAMIRELHRMQEEGILHCAGKAYTVYFDGEEANRISRSDKLSEEAAHCQL